MWSFFTQKEIPHNLRKGQALPLPRARSKCHGTTLVHFRGSLVWNNLPNYIKSSRAVYELKKKLKNFEDVHSGCLTCRT